MNNHLRAFLFEASHADGQKLVDSLYGQWDCGNSVCVINKSLPEPMLNSAILKADPSEVDDLSGNSTTRDLAIVETPDLAVVALTSGTTSNPKPVELSFRAMQSSTNSLYRAANLEKDTKWLCTLPPYYIAGLSIIARSWVNGQRLIFHNNFDIDNIQKEINTGAVDAISLIPSQLKALLNANVDLTPLQAILIGGSSIDLDLQNTVFNLGLNAYFTYGMTETFGGICLNHKLFDNTDVQIVDGQIYIHSGSMMSGYRHDERLTFHKLTPDGWFATGDTGSFDNSTLLVNGRIDDIINSGGIKVEPEMIQAALQSIGQFECAVVSTPHDQLGQCVTVIFKNADKLPSIFDLRDQLRGILPSTHLPIRIATSTDFDGNTDVKINRKNVADTCKIIEEYNLEK